MLNKLKSILDNNLSYNLIILMGFNISIIFSGSVILMFSNLIFGLIVAYKIISSQEKDFSEKKKQILNEDFTFPANKKETVNNPKIDPTLDKGTNLFNEIFSDRKAMENLIKQMFPGKDIKVNFIDDFPFQDTGFVGSSNNKNRTKPSQDDFTDRVIYLGNKLDLLTGKRDQKYIDEHKKLYDLMLEQGQNDVAEEIYNHFFNTNFEPTFEEKLNFFKNKFTDVTLHTNKVENNKLTLLFLVDIEKNGDHKFLQELRDLALKKEMYEFLIELDEYEKKERNKSL